jgi:curved DNA-binding protein CbpA
MNKLENAYRILGISEYASVKEVHLAYRRMAKKYHPDSNPENTDNALKMMMKINEAYEAIKNHIREEGVKKPAEQTRSGGATGKKQPVYHATKARYTTDAIWERAARERREREAFYRHLEKTVKERNREREEGERYAVILENISILFSFFYEHLLYSSVVRTRPGSAVLLQRFEDNYDRVMKKCAEFVQHSHSRFYRRKAYQAYKFLSAFTTGMRNIDTAGLERRAGACHMYEKAVYESDKFIGAFFTDDSTSADGERALFGECLDSFEIFLRAYPDSVLIEQAKRRLDILENLYRAFMKE